MSKPVSAEEFAVQAKTAIASYKAEIAELKRQLAVLKKSNTISKEVTERLADLGNAEHVLSEVCNIVKVDPADIEVTELPNHVKAFIDRVDEKWNLTSENLKRDHNTVQSGLVEKIKELTAEKTSMTKQIADLTDENLQLTEQVNQLEADLLEAKSVPAPVLPPRVFGTKKAGKK